jgi:superfamily I DNA/RNA helicase
MASRASSSCARDRLAGGDVFAVVGEVVPLDMCAEFLRKRKLPHPLRRNSSSVFDPAHDSIKVMTPHVSKGLEYPAVALVGTGRMPAEVEDEREEARVF